MLTQDSELVMLTGEELQRSEREGPRRGSSIGAAIQRFMICYENDACAMRRTHGRLTI
jgi:hypothetical protein